MAICKYCGKEIDNSKIGGHTTFCEKNPNRDNNLEKCKKNIVKMTEASVKSKRDSNYIHCKKEIMRVCEKCGKEFSQFASQYSIDHNNINKFCCRSCANSHVDACKGKTKYVECVDCGKLVEVKLQTDPKKVRCSECACIHKSLSKTDSSASIERVCVICGKTFVPQRIKNDKFSSTKYCSKECKKVDKIENGKKAYAISKQNGTHKPWQSRNITSYPEKFWINVLNNNNIEYKKEYFLTKYFLDFYIEINGRKIDLEIDGGQHNTEDHSKHDKVRDEFIKSQGIEVYRIPWNEVNSKNGKLIMKKKIDDFLVYYNQQ